jgi:archaellum component FlaC
MKVGYASEFYGKLYVRMGEETTQNIPDSRSFEERVFARFDAMDARFDSIDARLNGMDVRLDGMDARLDSMDRRLEALEIESERRALETKPIWERALAEILEVKEGLYNVERKLEVLSRDIIQVRGDQLHLERRLDKLESKPTQ